jgi:hypothetical protein
VATVEDLLLAHSPEVRELTMRARGLILTSWPEFVEQVDLPSKLLAYGRGWKNSEIVFTLMPQRTYVNLGVADGATLPDPTGLLAGTGRKHRHVKITSCQELESEALMGLLKAAIIRAVGPAGGY